jgi:hypothetical protein
MKSRVALDNTVTIEPASFERAMTTYIADKMSMTVDTDIFRGGIPLNFDGCGVAFVGQEKQNNITVQRYEICISCIDNSRDNVMQTIHDLEKKFPVYGESILLDTGETITLKAMLKNSIEFNRQISDDGASKHFGELSLIVVI